MHCRIVTFGSVKKVLEVAGHTDEAGRMIAETTFRTFHPALILTRLSGRSGGGEVSYYCNNLVDHVWEMLRT